MKKINISSKRCPNTFVLVDNEDFKWLNQWRWYQSNSGYACRAVQTNGKLKSIIMHRLIMKTKHKMEVDHIDMDKLNNQRSNLRNVTSSQNKMAIPLSKTNTSGYKGIDWIEKVGKWRARISLNNKTIHIGLFKQINDACKAYNRSVLKFHGDVSYLHKINGNKTE